ncbi:unnamed protein product [Closterium sp. NIES-54]
MHPVLPRGQAAWQRDEVQHPRSPKPPGPETPTPPAPLPPAPEPPAPLAPPAPVPPAQEPPIPPAPEPPAPPAPEPPVEIPSTPPTQGRSTHPETAPVGSVPPEREPQSPHLQGQPPPELVSPEPAPPESPPPTALGSTSTGCRGGEFGRGGRPGSVSKRERRLANAASRRRASAAARRLSSVDESDVDHQPEVGHRLPVVGGFAVGPCRLTKSGDLRAQVGVAHCSWSAASPAHPTTKSAPPNRGRGQHPTPVNIQLRNLQNLQHLQQQYPRLHQHKDAKQPLRQHPQGQYPQNQHPQNPHLQSHHPQQHQGRHRQAAKESSLPAVPDPESNRARATSPSVSRLLATVVTDPSFESAAASTLVAELLDFAAACRLDYATALVAESASASPPSVRGECALGTEVLEDRQEDFECLAAAVPRFASMLLAPEGDPDAPDIPTPRSYAEAITGPYSSQWQAAMDAEMASWKSTGTYVDEVPPPRANIVDGMWIFRVKRRPGSPPAFKACYVAQGFSQQQGVDYFQTFSPTPKMTTLWVLLHVTAQRDYELLSLDFSTAFLQGSLHKEIWLRRPPGFTGSFPAGTQWSLRRPVYGLRQAPREWHDTLRTTLAALGFAPATADPSLFLRTDTSLPLFYVLVYVDDLAFATADTEALTLVKSELQKRHTCTDLGELRSYLGLQITRDRARRTITLTQSHMVHEVLLRFGF